MNLPDPKNIRLATGIKWAIGIAAAVLIAPVVYLAIKGIVGLAVAAIAGLVAVNGMPVVAMKLANWKLRGMKWEARSNPIETRQALAIKARERIGEAEKAFTDFATEVRNFADEVNALSQSQPADAADFAEQLRKLRQLLALKEAGLKAARESADAFEAATERAARKWKVAQSAIRMNRLAGAAADDALSKILADESLDSVQTAMNRALSELDTAIAMSSPVMVTHQPAEVIEMPAAVKTAVAR